VNIEPYFVLIPLIIGLAALAVAVWDYRRTRALVRHGQAATGVYAGVEQDTSNAVSEDGASLSVTEYSTVEFQTLHGETVRFRGRAGGSGKQGLVGKPVDVIYDPAETANARINSFAELWLVALIFGILGAAFTLGALVLWLLI
jgi:hypothetical protein